MQKLTSRKFWGAVIVTACVLYLAIFENADAGTCAGAIAAAWVGYGVSEGYVDGKREESSQTIDTTNKNVNANTDSATTANKIIAATDKKEA